jgi:hypothetical protein
LRWLLNGHSSFSLVKAKTTTPISSNTLSIMVMQPGTMELMRPLILQTLSQEMCHINHNQILILATIVAHRITGLNHVQSREEKFPCMKNERISLLSEADIFRGELHRQNFARPLKRQKPNAPIITKYPVPPHLQQGHIPQQIYGTAPYNYPVYPAHNGLHGPPTPISAQSPSRTQWQQPPHHQRYSQQYQQGVYHQQNNAYPSPYPTPTAQTPSPFHNAYNGNYQGPSQVPPFNRNFPQATNQYKQPHGLPGQAFSGASPSSMTSPSNGYPIPQHREFKGNFGEGTKQGPQRPNQPPQVYPEKRKTHPLESTNGQPEADDLKALDIPDLPSSSTLLTDEIILAGRASFRLVKRPLPANFIVADAIAPFEAARAEDQGRCESKYWSNGILSELSQHVRNSSDWDDLLNDPIFLDIPVDSEIIPLEDLTSLYNPRHYDDGIEESEEQLEEIVTESKNPQNGEDMGDVMDSLEHALSEGRRKQPDSTYNTTDISNEPVQPSNNTEELLAALGVTGAPKPVRAPARPYPPPSQEQQGQVPSDGRAWSSSKSSSRYESRAVSNSAHNSSHCSQYHRQLSHDGRSRSNSEVNIEYHDREGADMLKQADSYTNRYSAREHTPTGQTIHGSTERTYPLQYEQPPPPPPLVQKPLFSEGIGIRPLSAGQNLGNHPLFADHNSEISASHNRQAADGVSSSPSKIRSERYNGRKREYDHRDSSDENETPGRRQVDDVTPKLKRRQPKVAEAYR